MRSSSGRKAKSAPSRRLFLTDSAISKLSSQRERRLIYHDSQLTGFQIVVDPRTISFRIRVERAFVSLGDWPIVSADEARAAALTLLRNKLASGPLYSNYEGTLVIKPQQIATQSKSPAIALNALLENYLSTRRLKPRTADDYRCVLRRYTKDWLNKDWKTITSDKFEERFDIASSRSPSQANYFLRIISALWTYGCAKYDISIPNPTQRTKVIRGLHVIKPRDRLIPDSVYPRWWKAVDEFKNREASAFMTFVALTGCRRSEALGLDVSDIDWHDRIVTFKDTKNGMSHRLPLGERLSLYLYQHCRNRTGRIFKLNDHGVDDSALAVSKTIGFKWIPHDLRRTFITVAHRTLKDLATVKKLVNHSSSSDVTMKHYLRLSVEDLREPMQRVEDALYILRSHSSYTPTLYQIPIQQQAESQE